MKDLHFIGIGGIGMSALAAAAADLNWHVSGSDRGAEKSENAAIFNALKSQGIAIYPQDGSRFAEIELPEYLIYSTAIEADNPDFLAAGDIPRLHRSELLGILLEKFNKLSIAVTGSCGKSTVSGYLTETLERLGADPVMIFGALSKRFRTPENAGNYRSGQGRYLVFEADESDKSLLRYGADYAIILNIGTDHYDKAELARVFGEFLHNIRRGAVVSQEVFEAVKAVIPATLPVRVINGPIAMDSLAQYLPGGAAPARAVCGDGAMLSLPAPGRHMAENALFIRALLNMLEFDDAAVLQALSSFDGVWRRNDFAGKTAAGAQVFDDYAHNPEKIVSCLAGMRERCTGNIYAVFQPHGYGPFGFMQEALREKLDGFLRPGDRFILLEPYYAGGTSSFSPHAAEVCEQYRRISPHPENYLCFPDRASTAEFLHAHAGTDDLIVIMGARDNSLNIWAHELAGK